MVDHFPFKSALVTGGGGFIGSHLVERLLKLNVKVTCLDNFSGGKMENISTYIDNPLLTVAKADITDYDGIVDLFKGIEIVFHQAVSKNSVCLINPRLDLRTNAEGTFNVLEASRTHGVKKIVHASTGSVYGEPRYVPEDELHPTEPVSFYGTSKLAAEKYGMVFRQLYGMDVSVLRYFHVYGPRQEDNDYGGVVSIFIRRALNGLPPIIFGDGSQIRSFTYVADVVKANLLVACSPAASGEIYNCASGLKIPIRRLADIVLEQLGRSDLRIQYSGWKPGDIKNFDISNDKIKNIGMSFDWDFEQGVAATVQWLRGKYGGQAG
ncbi:NAD-dependent epimerase/dehydratase family protein [Paenibacillus sp. LHD-117]|uniref:NAD-dependent epimerase/dehydratase family protein n=1 Tax=Paenibacillus sp. LHD-117 TaxID=3071412 RepID=UPI0027DEAD46|nr:NAD-dependent epimerase/dehydratase family protein [Paenibacillus sp. LHD-117]MDQ6418340.1 NAD-dependent epimerase/dehydratase family protein [Paenibacillus sp. LHD-117]